MRGLLPALALLALGAGCAGLAPATRLPDRDPRPAALLAAWRARTGDRDALLATARFAVEAEGAGVGGRHLSLRSNQRMWLARPARLRVEVQGFLDTTLAVLATDGDRYALLQADERHFEEGPVYEGLLWDAARLDLTPREAVEVILGAPQPDADLARGAAFAVGDRLRIELVDAGGSVRRVVEFGAGGELRRLARVDADGELLWEAHFDDYADLGGAPFAHHVSLRSASGRARAELTLRGVELNPHVSPDIFQLRAPADLRSDPASGLERLESGRPGRIGAAEGG